MMHSIVIVEDRAEMPLGHFPNEFAILADGFIELGLDVDVLTRRGWALEGSRARSWNLHLAGPLADRLLGVARRAMAKSVYFAGRSERPLGIRARFGAVLRTIVLIFSARRLARSGSGEPAPIVVVAMDFIPALLLIFGGRDRWLIWQFTPDVWLSRFARIVEGTRRAFRRPARHVVLAAHNDAWLDAVAELLPGFEVVSIPLLASRTLESDRDSSRAALGLDADAKVAVLFAAGHPGQAPQPVVDAFRQRPDWQLVIGGQVCTRIDSSSLADWETPPLMFAGFIEEAVRDRLFASADLAVVSHVAHLQITSGTVMDAASHRKPILVSSGSLAAGLVERTGAGELFEAESSQSLLEALDRIDLDLAGEGSERLRVMFSPATVCGAHLAALGRSAWLDDAGNLRDER
jgi:hypothetical protein